ncbi:MAG: hypothetical protein Q8P67_15235, partial [archaeon]|nr:hypothetical protein [archaeon]
MVTLGDNLRTVNFDMGELGQKSARLKTPTPFLKRNAEPATIETIYKAYTLRHLAYGEYCSAVVGESLEPLREEDFISLRRYLETGDPVSLGASARRQLTEPDREGGTPSRADGGAHDEGRASSREERGDGQAGRASGHQEEAHRAKKKHKGREGKAGAGGTGAGAGAAGNEAAAMPFTLALEDDLKAQMILRRVKARREDQGLPPFFGMLTGPTLGTPYRVEQLHVVLGRVSSTNRSADVAVSESPKVSHRHVSLEFSKRDMIWYLINLSKNGSLVRSGTAREWIALEDVGSRVPLGNPAAINMAGIIVYWQLFYIADGNADPWATYLDPSETSSKTGKKVIVPKRNVKAASSSSSSSRKPEKAAPGRKKRLLAEISQSMRERRAPAEEQPRSSSSSRDAGGSNGLSGEPSSPTASKRGRRSKAALEAEAASPATYASMIVEALTALGGRATQKEIADWISQAHPDVTGKSTWRNSVSGILSANKRFQAETITLDNGRKARWSLWVLKPPEEEEGLDDEDLDIDNGHDIDHDNDNDNNGEENNDYELATQSLDEFALFEGDLQDQDLHHEDEDDSPIDESVPQLSPSSSLQQQQEKQQEQQE